MIPCTFYGDSGDYARPTRMSVSTRTSVARFFNDVPSTRRVGDVSPAWLRGVPRNHGTHHVTMKQNQGAHTRLVSGPRGRDRVAQGNALGQAVYTCQSPEGARYLSLIEGCPAPLGLDA